MLNQDFRATRSLSPAIPPTKTQKARPSSFAVLFCDYDCISGHARHFPLRLKVGPDRRAGRHASAITPCQAWKPNRRRSPPTFLPPPAPIWHRSACLIRTPTRQTAELIWYHALAIGYSPAYLAENADGIRQDWPRIPLPQAKDSLLASAALGRQVAALLDTEAPVPGVTAGKIRDDLKSIAVFQRVDGKPAKPEAGDLDLTAGWGHAGKGGVTMPGKGKLIRRDDGACDIFPQRYRMLAERTRDGVGLHHRRLPGHQEVAIVPRKATPWPWPDVRRSPLCHGNGAPPRCTGCPASQTWTRTTERRSMRCTHGQHRAIEENQSKNGRRTPASNTTPVPLRSTGEVHA